MNAEDLKIGMIVKCRWGSVVKVTYIPRFDENRECFFSGILLDSKDPSDKDRIGKNYERNWNSAFYNK